MYDYIVKAFAEGLAKIIVWVFIIGAAIGAGIIWVVPTLWNWAFG